VPLFERLHRKPAREQPAPEPSSAPIAEPPVEVAAAVRAAPDLPTLLREFDQLVELESDVVRNRQPHLPAREVEPVLLALAATHDPAATAALVAAASRAVVADAPLTLGLLEALAGDGSRAAADGLVAVALGRPQDVADRAAATLVEAALPEALASAVARLDDPDPAVRGRAAGLVARVGGTGATPFLTPLLDDPDASVREQAASALGDVADEDAVLALLVAEETDRRSRRAGLSSVTFSGKLSPYLLAVARIATGDRGVGWDLSGPLPYDGEEQLQRLVAPAGQARSAELATATVAVPEQAAPQWGTAELASLLVRGSISQRGNELRYLDARQLVTDRERCRRLGLAVTEAAGESHTTVYGEKRDEVVDVVCHDGTLHLVGDRDDVLRLEGAR
jgi:hypothetical protein